MKLSFTHSARKYLIAYLGVCLLAVPIFVKANNSHIYNEVITTSNSGGQTSNSGSASVEVSNTTIINGERSSYRYATSTTGSIEHQVIIEHSPPAAPVVISETIATTTAATTSPHSLFTWSGSENDLDSTKLPAVSTTSTLAVLTPTQTVSWLENVLNYVYFYVEQFF
jgi:hypothetical protein